MQKDIFARFKRTVGRYGMIAAGDSLLVACSGGADSTALLHLLLELRRETPFELGLAHFNHRLRPAADEDERFVRDEARKLGLPLVVERRDVKAYARGKKLNLEEAARVLRYGFLERAAARAGATRIATGHTLNDQAETFLMRLLRGSGPRGLGGIHPVVKGKIIRPLIEISRNDIEAFCRRKKLPFRTDETNRDRRFLRNKIRLGLIPYLERHYEPGLVSKLGRLALILQDEEAVLEKMTQEQYSGLIVRKDSHPSLDARNLAKLPRGMARRVVRAFLKDRKGDLRRISFEDVEAVINLGEDRELTLPDKLRLRREGGFIFLKEKTAPKAPSSSYLWDGKNPLHVLEAGMTFTVEKMKKPNQASWPFDDQSRCYGDAGKLSFPLLVRPRREGDRYQPLGTPGRKKLKEILRAKKIPLSDRDRLPVFCSEGNIVWIPGLPVAEDFKITPRTKTVFCLKRISTHP